jgi:hypothetical protein
LALVASVVVATFSSFVPASSAAPLSVQVAGSGLVDGSGILVQLRGVNRSGTEYACSQGWGIFDGASDQASVSAMASWHVNAVRIPMNEDCWLDINGVNPAVAGASYQQAIINYVNLLNKYGMYAILDLSAVAPGTTVPAQVGSPQEPMPDQDHSPDFWASVAATFKGNPAVLFDLYNEPFPDNNQTTTAAWTCWRDGGTCPGVTYPAAGMQELVNTVRATGATNVITLPGIGYASVFDQWGAYEPTDPAPPGAPANWSSQLVADFHNYSFGGCTTSACWNTIPGDLNGAPLLTGEMGFDGYIETYMSWADAHGVGYLAWTWDTWGCSGGQALISDYTGTPCDPYGTGYQQHLSQLPNAVPFRLRSGAATDIGAGANGSVWVVGTNPVAGGFGIYRWTGSGWASLRGGAVAIAVDPSGNPWVVNSAHQIFQWNGSAWVSYPGAATDISVGANGSLWVVGTHAVVGGYGIYHWNGKGWTRVLGGAIRIAVDPSGNPWVINSTHHLYHWTGMGWPSTPIAGTAISVGANGSVWVVGTNAVSGGYGISRLDGNYGVGVPGGAVGIAVGPSGNPWIINSAQQIYSS